MANWDDLRIFLAVARAQSLSSAAPGLRMDPATVSRRIARLERDLGAALFVKSPQGYALTDFGNRTYERAADAEDLLTLALERSRSRQEGLTGQIRIGAPDGVANYILPQVCARLQNVNPGLEIQVLALPRVINLSRREADLAITVSAPEAGRLTVQKLTDYHLHLAAHRDLSEAITDREALETTPLVGYIADMIFDRELDYLGDLANRDIQLASNSVAVQAMMLRAKGGVGFIHDFILPYAPELAFVLYNEISLRRSFYLVRHAVDRRSDRLNRFVASLVDEFRAEVVQLEAKSRKIA